jgi:hypothetical protein
MVYIPMDDDRKFSIREYRNKIYQHIHAKKKEIRKEMLMQQQKALIAKQHS